MNKTTLLSLAFITAFAHHSIAEPMSLDWCNKNFTNENIHTCKNLIISNLLAEDGKLDQSMDIAATQMRALVKSYYTYEHHPLMKDEHNQAKQLIKLYKNYFEKISKACLASRDKALEFGDMELTAYYEERALLTYQLYEDLDIKID